MTGAFWGKTDNLLFTEEKHETGYCLEVSSSKRRVKAVVTAEGLVEEWEDDLHLVDKITVPQAEDLAERFKLWAETMRNGNHYISHNDGMKNE